MDKAIVIKCHTWQERLDVQKYLIAQGYDLAHTYALFNHVVVYPDRHIGYVYFEIDSTREAHYDRLGMRIVNLSQAKVLLSDPIPSVDNLSFLFVQITEQPVDKPVDVPVVPVEVPPTPVKLKWWQRAVLTIKNVFSFLRNK